MINKYFYILFLSVISLSVHPFSFVSHKASDGALAASFLTELKEVFKIDVFVETGTYDGSTALRAATFFQQVYTVEFSPSIFEQAQRKLAATSNVQIFHDSSPHFLEKIIPQCKGSILFWLDAHYSGGSTAMSTANISDPEAMTPIRNELKAIARSGVQDCVILVDDIVYFGSTIGEKDYLGDWAYPTIHELKKIGLQINLHFEFALLGAQLLMYDKRKFNPPLSKLISACTQMRLYDGTNMSQNDLKWAEKVIMSIEGPEKIYMIHICKHIMQWDVPLFYHDLWYGLICIGNQEWHEAESAMEKVTSKLFDDLKLRQRIDSYLGEIRNHIKL